MSTGKLKAFSLCVIVPDGTDCRALRTRLHLALSADVPVNLSVYTAEEWEDLLTGRNLVRPHGSPGKARWFMTRRRKGRVGQPLLLQMAGQGSVRPAVRAPAADLTAGDNYNIAFHCQQAIEKALKGYLL